MTRTSFVVKTASGKIDTFSGLDIAYAHFITRSEPADLYVVLRDGEWVLLS